MLTSGPEDMLVLSILDDYDVVAARNSEELPNLMNFMLSGTHILASKINQTIIFSASMFGYLLGFHTRVEGVVNHDVVADQASHFTAETVCRLLLLVTDLLLKVADLLLQIVDRNRLCIRLSAKVVNTSILITDSYILLVDMVLLRLHISEGLVKLGLYISVSFLQLGDSGCLLLNIILELLGSLLLHLELGFQSGNASGESCNIRTVSSKTSLRFCKGCLSLFEVFLQFSLGCTFVFELRDQAIDSLVVFGIVTLFLLDLVVSLLQLGVKCSLCFSKSGGQVGNLSFLNSKIVTKFLNLFPEFSKCSVAFIDYLASKMKLSVQFRESLTY